MRPYEADLHYLKQAVPELKSYLLSKELYWPVSGQHEPGLQRLTVGNVLLTEARLKAYPHPEISAGWGDLYEQIAAVRRDWRTHWQNKVLHEFPSRLNIWRDHLKQLHTSESTFRQHYPTQIRQRAILHLLLEEIGVHDLTEREILRGLDGSLRLATVPGPFAWEPELAGGFPPEIYWFLYLKYRAEG